MLQYSNFSEKPSVPFVKQSECMKFDNNNEKIYFNYFLKQIKVVKVYI